MKWTFKARDCALESHKNAVSDVVQGVVSKKFSEGKPPILLIMLATKPTLGIFV